MYVCVYLGMCVYVRTYVCMDACMYMQLMISEWVQILSFKIVFHNGVAPQILAKKMCEGRKNVAVYLNGFGCIWTDN